MIKYICDRCGKECQDEAEYRYHNEMAYKFNLMKDPHHIVKSILTSYTYVFNSQEVIATRLNCFLAKADLPAKDIQYIDNTVMAMCKSISKAKSDAVSEAAKLIDSNPLYAYFLGIALREQTQKDANEFIPKQTKKKR